MNSATDNPLVFVETERIVSGGNFHGQPVSLALDVAAMALTQLSAISERRVEQLVNPSLSGLPPFLAKNSGLNSGFMIAQVTSAALVAESRVLSHPASVDSIPSSAGREDHVSMGMTAALKARQVAEFTRSCLAIELLVAAQALDYRQPVKAGRGAQAAYELHPQQGADDGAGSRAPQGHRGGERADRLGRAAGGGTVSDSRVRESGRPTCSPAWPMG